MARIDVHQHLLPPDYVAWLTDRGIGESGGRDLPEWSTATALELMDRYDIRAAVLSLSTPGTYLGDGRDALRMARTVNEFASAAHHEHPDRIGFFATVPLPDVEGSIAEVKHALDNLHADGVILLANNSGTYLGDPSFEPLMAELNERSAVVFVHPHALPGPDVPGLPAFAADFLLDTTRAAMNLVKHDVLRRYPNLKFILAHAGGFLPYASHRIMAALFADTGRLIPDILEDFSSFYFDTALSSSPAALPSLLAFAKPGHVLFGSDWPFAPELAVAYFTAHLDRYLLDDDVRASINEGAAVELFPHFA